jgi:hypothetical protein
MPRMARIPLHGVIRAIRGIRLSIRGSAVSRCRSRLVAGRPSLPKRTTDRYCDAADGTDTTPRSHPCHPRHQAVDPWFSRVSAPIEARRRATVTAEANHGSVLRCRGRHGYHSTESSVPSAASGFLSVVQPCLDADRGWSPGDRHCRSEPRIGTATPRTARIPLHGVIRAIRGIRPSIRGSAVSRRQSRLVAGRPSLPKRTTDRYGDAADGTDTTPRRHPRHPRHQAVDPWFSRVSTPIEVRRRATVVADADHGSVRRCLALSAGDRRALPVHAVACGVAAAPPP